MVVFEMDNNGMSRGRMTGMSIFLRAFEIRRVSGLTRIRLQARKEPFFQGSSFPFRPQLLRIPEQIIPPTTARPLPNSKWLSTAGRISADFKLQV